MGIEAQEAQFEEARWYSSLSGSLQSAGQLIVLRSPEMGQKLAAAEIDWNHRFTVEGDNN